MLGVEPAQEDTAHNGSDELTKTGHADDPRVPGLTQTQTRPYLQYGDSKQSVLGMSARMHGNDTIRTQRALRMSWN